LQQRLAKNGLTPAQLEVLSHLARLRQPQRVTDIARAVQSGQLAVTKMLARFEEAGWVTIIPDKEVRISKSAQVTAAGYQHLQIVQRAALPELRAFLKSWPKEGLRRFAEDLTRLGRFLDDRRNLDE